MKFSIDIEMNALSFEVLKCEECRHPFSDGTIEHYPECRYFVSDNIDDVENPAPETSHTCNV
jgi:hypothetical protein